MEGLSSGIYIPTEDGGEGTQVNFSQRMQGAPDLSLLPNHNYSLGRNSQDFGCRSQERGKLFNDPVHGHFRLDPIAVKIIDTPQFQRLSDLKQLGCTYYVFRGASHNRAEHSMGVAHLAYTLANQIYQLQGKDLDITRSDVKCAEVAGLVHDLGHGPYSHVFDRFMTRMNRDWQHERMSVELLEDILGGEQSHTISRDLSDEEIKHIEAMITCEKGGQPAPSGKRWLYEIVANNRNGLDVDKYDYLQRDSMYCNTKISVDIKRIFSFVKVLDDELCYKYSEYHNIYEVYATRARMFRNVYLHRKANAVEHMIVDALVGADPVFRLADATESAQDFAKLDDSILKAIEYYGTNRPGFGSAAIDADDEGETSVRNAQAILKRLRKRDLYKFVEEFLVPQEVLANGRWVPPTAADIIAAKGSNLLRADDIIISEVKVDLTKGDRNPMDNVSFFDYPESTEKRKVPPHQISTMFPICNRELWCRVFTRNSHPDVVRATQEAAREYVKHRFGGTVQMATPIRRKRPVNLPNGISGNGVLQREDSNPRKRSLSQALDAAEQYQQLTQ